MGRFVTAGGCSHLAVRPKRPSIWSMKLAARGHACRCNKPGSAAAAQHQRRGLCLAALAAGFKALPDAAAGDDRDEVLDARRRLQIGDLLVVEIPDDVEVGLSLGRQRPQGRIAGARFARRTRLSCHWIHLRSHNKNERWMIPESARLLPQRPEKAVLPQDS